MPDENNPYSYSQSQPVSPQPAVWPPPPTAQLDAPPIPYLPFLFLYNRVSGNISDIREGILGLQPNGLAINGKSQIRQEIATPILVVMVLTCTLLGLIASLLFRYAFMQPTQLFVPNENITEIILEPKTRKAGIAFQAPNYKGVVKPFCLCFQLAQDSFPVFASWAMYVAADRTHEGRLKSGTSTTTWVIAGVLLLSLIILFVWAIGFSGHR